MKRYEDEYFYYAWKPQGMPTTFGSQFSFVEEIETQYPPFFAALAKVWTHEEEWGLLNRLDNDTGGLVYFAKSKEIASRYHKAQDDGNVAKRYLCDVKGDMLRFVHTDTQVMRTDTPWSQEKALCVSYPLMHHAYDDQKMVIVRRPNDAEKGRSKHHLVKTFFLPLYYDEQRDTTCAYAVITKGIRHQIRAHAAGIGYPLVGDRLYKGVPDELLHLRSVGLSIAE